MNIPSDLQYTKSHEWVRFTDGATVKIGLTDYAQSSLGSLVFVNLPGEGDKLKTGEILGDVESVKAVSDIYSPVTGIVGAVNGELLDAPEKINEDPYGAWLVEIKNIEGKPELMDAAAYEAFCKKEEDA